MQRHHSKAMLEAKVSDCHRYSYMTLFIDIIVMAENIPIAAQARCDQSQFIVDRGIAVCGIHQREVDHQSRMLPQPISHASRQRTSHKFDITHGLEKRIDLV